MPETPTHMTPNEHRELAVALFNHVWTLLEREARTARLDDEMLHAAHASRYHWGASGRHAEPMRLITGEWQCSRVYSVLGRADPALWHARRALALCDEHDVQGFFRGTAHEALARALRLAGDPAEAERHGSAAREIAAELDDEEDREILLGDLTASET